MTPPSIDDLYELYRLLKERVDRLTGIVEQLRAEGNRDTLSRPTWRDIEALRKDILRLEKMLSDRPPRRLPRGKGGV